MRDDVGGGDRDQRVREAAAELPAVQAAGAGPRHALGAEPPERADHPDRDQQADHEGELQPDAQRRAERGEEVLQVGPHAVEQRPLLGAVEAGRADPDHEQRDGARDGRQPRRARDRRPQHHAPVLARGGTARASRTARTRRRTRRRGATTPRRRRRPGPRAARTRRSASASPAARARGRSPSTARRSRTRGSPAAAGQCPSRSGYGNASVASPRESRPATQPVARPIARHGLNSRNQSPISSDRNGTATQKPT